MKSRIYATVVLMVIFCTVMAQEVTINGVTYKVKKGEASAYVEKENKNIREAIVLPQVEVEGKTYPVTMIGVPGGMLIKSFWDCTMLRTVKLPSTIKQLGEGAFRGCASLESIVLPEGLETIGLTAFSGCQLLQSVNIPNSVKEIKNYAFSNCSALSELILPDKPVIIKAETFSKCDALYNVRTQSGGVPGYALNYLPKSCAYMMAKRYIQSAPQNSQLYASTPLPPAQHVEQASQQQPVTKVPAPQAPSSDVDVDIPQVTASNENTFAVIFANEDYQEEVNVEFAKNDGEMFKTYCHKVLGLPEDNIHFRKNATRNNMIAEMAWLQKVADAYKGQVRFIIYYAGHGIPDEKSGTSYLLPVDGKGTMLETGYSLKSFYEQLGNMPSQGVTVFMDACFSGSKRGDGMLTSARGVVITPRPQAPQGKMVVFSAAQGNETAYPFKEKGHGLFTYYLLKKLKETQGKVSLNELGNYVTDQVSRKSIVSNGKSQTPSISVSQSMGEEWKELKLR